ncbi:MAG: transglutaminase [Gemmatales bacterium]|nr:MAG: transglutaminase [Gemmatales bacterium]
MLASSVMHSFVVVMIAAPPAAQYRIESRPVQRIEAILRYAVHGPKLKAKEWVFVMPVPGKSAAQTDIQSISKPTSEIIADLSPLKRPLMRFRIPATNPEKQQKAAIEIAYRATLHSRRLVLVPANQAVGKGYKLTETERRYYLSPTDSIDWKSAKVQDWIKQNGLQRKQNEGAVDFARRVFQVIRAKYGYVYDFQKERKASVICDAGKTDCGGLAVLYAAVLRANGVPARLLFGRWAESAKPTNGVFFYQWHVKSEFFDRFAGWVPVDLTLAISADKTEDGRFSFGFDQGKFLTLHVDPDLRFDTIYYGKVTEAALQMPKVWVIGDGTFEGAQSDQSWIVKKLP